MRLSLFLLYLVNRAHFLLYDFFIKVFVHDELPVSVIFHAMSTNLNAVVGCWWKSANAEFSRKAKTYEATGNRKNSVKVGF